MHSRTISNILPRAPTGIDKLDEILGGGLIRGKTYLVAGETGTGKTIFALSFIVYGAALDEAGVYVTVDEDVESFMLGAKAFGWDLEKLVEKGRLSIVSPSEDFIDRIRRKDPDAVAKSLVRDISDVVERIGAQRLVIDPIAPLVCMEKDIQVLREFTRILITRLEREVRCTTLITSEIPSGSLSLSRFGVEEFLASGVFVLGLIRRGSRFIRTLTIRKMRWLPVKPTVYEFEIVPGRGIVIKGPLEESSTYSLHW